MPTVTSSFVHKSVLSCEKQCARLGHRYT